MSGLSLSLERGVLRSIVIQLSKTCPLVAVVDDEESIGRALKRLLRASGLEVVTYSSGGEFLDSLKANRPDCIVLDIHMPQVSGFDVQAFVSRMRPRLPIVMITGRDAEETRQSVIEAGAVAYLCKPVDEQALLAAVTAAIAQGEPETESMPPPAG
jgi:FixJ family two-component response regulator